MTRIIPVLAAAMAAMTPAALASDLLGELNACRGLGDGERLACFDRVLAGHDATPTRSDFGAERLPQAAAKEPDTMVAHVAKVSVNAFKQFTVTLDNGQVWRQLESDTAVARFTTANTVTISRGFLDSYSLSVAGAWGTYKVKRIK
jgi:hypothetical protein